MAIVKMNRSGQGYGNDQNHKIAYEYRETKSLTAGVGDSIIIPQDVSNVNVQLVFATGATGKVQYTNDPVGYVVAGTANWFDWDTGNTATNTCDVFYPPSAIRLSKTNDVGTLTFTVRAQ